MKKTFMDSSKLIKDNMNKLEKRSYKNIKIVHFKVDENNEKVLKKTKGDYFIINFDYIALHKQQKDIKREVIKILKVFLNDLNLAKPLILGLGNSSIPADSLGIKTTNKMMEINHFTDFLTPPKVNLFNPEVIAKTGISSYKLIEMVVKNLKPTIIIMIDSLATNNEEYLNNCIEINNTGIISSQAIKDNKKIDAKTFNIPVIAIGVPLILENKKNLYTIPNVLEIVDLTSNIISESLNKLFF